MNFKNESLKKIIKCKNFECLESKIKNQSREIWNKLEKNHKFINFLLKDLKIENVQIDNFNEKIKQKIALSIKKIERNNEKKN